MWLRANYGPPACSPMFRSCDPYLKASLELHFRPFSSFRPNWLLGIALFFQWVRCPLTFDRISPGFDNFQSLLPLLWQKWRFSASNVQLIGEVIHFLKFALPGKFGSCSYPKTCLYPKGNQMHPFCFFLRHEWSPFPSIKWQDMTGSAVIDLSMYPIAPEMRSLGARLISVWIAPK